MSAINISTFDNQHVKENELIRRILGGEKELYEILVRRNNQKLYRVIRSYLKEENQIQDTMQNTYIKAYSKLSQFKLEASFSTWLIRIGINESLAVLSSKDHLSRQEFRIDAYKNDAIIQIHDEKQLDPQERMIQNEAKQLLEDVIDSLDTKYKLVYTLREVEGMSLKEIAQVLELTLANVKVRLHRSKDMLKEKLYEKTHLKDVFEFGFGRCDQLTENVMLSI